MEETNKILKQILEKLDSINLKLFHIEKRDKDRYEKVKQFDKHYIIACIKHLGE